MSFGPFPAFSQFSKTLSFSLLWLCRCDVLSSSTLQKCINDGSSALSCETKVVLQISIEQGQGQSEEAQFDISAVTDQTGSAQSPIQLKKPMRVTWSKTAAMWRYPLRYVQDVNNKPQEHVIQVGFLQCNANWQASDQQATCGFAYQAGQRIQDSQGFCCGCNLANDFRGVATRADLTCPFAESAHCLGFDSLWYSVFEVAPSEISYEIDVSLALAADPSAAWQNTTYNLQTLKLSNSLPSAQSAGGNIYASLVGDMATAVSPWAFESMYLVVPSRPTTNPRVNVQLPLQNAMLIDKSMFDLSGLTCNKIGVSFTAFTNQPNQCQSPVQSCLSSQIDDLYQKDMQLLSSGQPPLYMVSGFCKGAVQLGAQVNAAGQTVFLACPLNQRHTSIMTLEVEADSVMFVTNVATGKIVSAKAASFEALMGSSGEADLEILNTGSVTAAFTVSVANCSGTVVPGPALKITLAPLQSNSYSISLLTQQTKGLNSTCTAVLLDAVGDVTDMVTFQVVVTDLITNTGAQAPIDRGGPTTGNSAVTGGDCAAMCNGLFDVACLFSKSCWSQLGLLLAIIIGIFILISCVICCCKRCIPCKIAAYLWKTCAPSDSSSSQKAPRVEESWHSCHQARHLQRPDDAHLGRWWEKERGF